LLLCGNFGLFKHARYHWRVNPADFFTGYLILFVFPPRTSLALALSITIHRNLLTRRILLALLVLVFFILTLAPFARTQRKSIRLAASASGTFGQIMSISLLAHVQSWSNVWERLWINDGNGWDSGPERALGYWLILIEKFVVAWRSKVCWRLPGARLGIFQECHPAHQVEFLVDLFADFVDIEF
jgi:hypothetical protein